MADMKSNYKEEIEKDGEHILETTEGHENQRK